ncbi:hypothetical protein JXB27_01700 [Candidatus Woesearchaeota archaeon]|nr:hypothetical protein [Candidatus Woesearchaeota archaeon]
MGKFIDNWEPPRLEERQNSFGWLWLIFLFVAIGLVVLFLMQQKTGSQAPSQTVQETSAPSASESSTPGASSAQPNVAASSAPEIDRSCTAVAGIVPGTTVRDGNVITVSFKNNGKVGIEGSYFEFSSGEKKIYKMNSEAVAIGGLVTYTVDLDDAAGELGSEVKSFVILPIQNGKACLNQRMVVIK